MVREAIESLRSCFRPHDPHHHTLDTLEQVLVRTFISVTSFLSLMLELWRIHLVYKCIITIISNFLLFILKIMYKCQCTLKLCGNRRKRGTQTILDEGKKW